jgi:HlyD family secretion protein
MGMDRAIEKKRWNRRRIIQWGGIVVIAFLFIYVFLISRGESRLNVESNRITISEVTRGPFQVYIPITGVVLPIRTVYLDAIEGGRVERVFREAGSYVTEGDTLLQLANTNLLLDIMNREAQLFEQRNNLRNTRLAMQRNSLELEGELAELEYQLAKARRTYEQNEKLVQGKMISTEVFENSRDEYEYLKKRLDLTHRTQEQDSIFRQLQIEMLEASVDRIQANLKIVRQNVENLFVKAPVSGRLTSLNAEIGESKSQGERLGQIDILDGFKVRAEVDEHYIARVDVGLTGRFELAGKEYELRLTKIYPEVSDGRFEVDLEFVGEPPADIRRGQSLHVRLELGSPTESVQIARGGFFRSTGGNWIYVVDPSGDYATKREIRLGRQNPQAFEVLDGLDVSEKVITSSYDNFGDVDRLILSN